MTRLWDQVVATTQTALATGALKPIATQSYWVPDGEIPFLVRVVDSIARKEAAQKQQTTPAGPQAVNPFLPYEEALFVAHLSETHVCLLNKFNVVEHHLLMVTRAFEPQENWLTEADFAALAQVLKDIPGLAFYNSGAAAGASQPHKHLQLIPFRSGQGADTVPIAALVAEYAPPFPAVQALPLPFGNAACTLRSLTVQELLAAYQAIMATLGLCLNGIQPDAPYNLLMTRDWMMGVRRSQGSFADISVNSLGYAGWLLVKTEADLERLRAIGPLSLLQQVGVSPSISDPTFSPRQLHE